MVRIVTRMVKIITRMVRIEKHQVQLSAGKTKLLVYSDKSNDYVKYSKLLSPLRIGNTPFEFASTAEHVGVVRAVSGNLPHMDS